MKVIDINDSGYVWQIPLSVIADLRAKHYAAVDPDTTYQEEFDYVMEDSYEGIDWFKNNMDFDDVKEHAKLVATPEPLKEPRVNSENCSVKLRDVAD